MKCGTAKSVSLPSLLLHLQLFYDIDELFEGFFGTFRIGTASLGKMGTPSALSSKKRCYGLKEIPGIEPLLHRIIGH